MTTLFFATDIHGSEICWKKFLNAGKFYSADVIVLGGDMTGKALVPISRQSDGTYKATLLEQATILHSEAEVQEMERHVKSRGYYPFRTTPEEVAELTADQGKLDDLFKHEMLKMVQEWMDLADQRLAGSGLRCFVCPGNDDMFEVDAIVRQARHVTLAEGNVVDLNEDFQMLSTGWSNRTPWDTYREEDEDAMAQRLEKMATHIRDMRLAIFSTHCPPYNSGLDEAPELDRDMRPVGAGHSLVPVGSTAVRAVIEKYQPALSLHGHIHEGRGTSKIGKTVCINPGSNYEQGILLGAVIKLDRRKGVKSYMLTSG